MVKVNLRNPGRTLHVGVILMGGETEILDVAPIDLINGLTKKFGEVAYLGFTEQQKTEALDIEFHWINEKKTPATLTSGITILPTDDFASCPPLDVVLMGAHWEHTPNEAELEFVRKAYTDCSAYLSICGGMMVPLAAGVLKGKTCTAPKPMLEMMEKGHPDVKWVKKRYVKDSDGKTWTSGTLLNGLDLMRAFVHDTWGGEGSLADEVIGIGAWPVRDVDYGDD